MPIKIISIRTMTNIVPAYGLWGLVIINIAIFLIFAFSYTQPKTPRDWRAFGAFSAFIIALFTEMYGFPLTTYFLSGWLVSKYPGLDLYSHNTGHLWETLFGWKGDPHLNPLHLLSDLLIVAGFFLLASAWDRLYSAQKLHKLATTGPYAHVRHPQYLAFIIIMTGFLLQWPTFVTLAMFPILIVTYAVLAKHEKQEMIRKYGKTYNDYRKSVPAFIPRFTGT